MQLTPIIGNVYMHRNLTVPYMHSHPINQAGPSKAPTGGSKALH